MGTGTPPKDSAVGTPTYRNGNFRNIINIINISRWMS